MKKELSQRERLDLAARAEAAEPSFGRRCVLGVLAVLGGLMAMGCLNPHKIFTSPAFAAGATFIALLVTVITAALIWFQWRYWMYAAAMLYFAVAITVLVFLQQPIDWTARIMWPAVFTGIGYKLLQGSAAVAAVHGKGWKKDRAQVRHWLMVLDNLGTEEQVFEISAGNFWRGYSDYRFMNSEGFWIVIRLRYWNNFRPLDYRILEQDAIKITKLPDGNLYIQIEKRTLGAVMVSAETRSSLLRFADAS